MATLYVFKEHGVYITLWNAFRVIPAAEMMALWYCGHQCWRLLLTLQKIACPGLSHM